MRSKTDGMRLENICIEMMNLAGTKAAQIHEMQKITASKDVNMSYKSCELGVV